VITDKYMRGTLVGAKIDLTYHVTKDVSVVLFFDFQKYFENRGDKTYHDYDINSTWYLPGGGGMSLEHQLFGIDIVYAF